MNNTVDFRLITKLLHGFKASLLINGIVWMSYTQAAQASQTSVQVQQHSSDYLNEQPLEPQCFGDAKQAYAYLINQQRLQQQSQEFAKSRTVVNINDASEAELTTLHGIGSNKAQQIILYRDAFGPFRSIDDLTNVKGVGAMTIANNRARLAVK